MMLHHSQKQGGVCLPELPSAVIIESLAVHSKISLGVVPLNIGGNQFTIMEQVPLGEHNR